MRIIVLQLFLLYIFRLITSAWALEVVDFRAPDKDIERYGKFEISFNLDTQFANPFDPEEVDIRAVFQTPAGVTFQATAFYTQDFSLKVTPVPVKRIIWDLREYIPASIGYWQVRFTPKTAGDYSYHLEIVSRKGSIRFPQTGELHFNCIASARHGFVGVDTKNDRYLRFEDGVSYWGVGFNGVNTMGACDQGGVRSFEVMTKSAQYGANLMQIDLCQGDYLEWTKLEKRGFPYYQAYEGLGKYNLQVASQIDSAVDLAESLGLYLRFSFFHWTDFYPEYNSGENTPGFTESPYFIRNGGPCRRPMEFFSDSEIFRYNKQLFRYVIARWGYSPNILCWVLWNEVDNVADFEMRTVGTWHKKALEYFRTNDPNHLITTSFSGNEKNSAFMKFMKFDVIETHNYIAFSGTLPYLIEDNLLLNMELFAGFNVPIIPGEFGYIKEDGFGPQLGMLDDEKGVHIHDQLWASLMAGCATSAMHWHWEKYFDKFNLYPRIQGITNFVKGEDFGVFRSFGEKGISLDCGTKKIRLVKVDIPTCQQKEAGMRGQVYYDTKNTAIARALGLVAHDRALIWVKDNSADFIADNPSPYLDNIVLSVSGMSDGNYNIEYWDTEKGVVSSASSGMASNGKITLEIPRFTGDIALKIYK